MDSVFKALADPSRRQILHILKTRDMNVTEISAHFNFTGASLSHHLDILKSARLIIGERRGKYIYYSLNTSVLEEVMQAFLGVFQK